MCVCVWYLYMCECPCADPGLERAQSHGQWPWPQWSHAAGCALSGLHGMNRAMFADDFIDFMKVFLGYLRIYHITST